MANIFQGKGDSGVAESMYASEALRVASELGRAGIYVCHANIIARMPGYNQEILNSVLWGLSLGGRL